MVSPIGLMARSDRGYLVAAMQCDEELFILRENPMSSEKRGVSLPGHRKAVCI